jgi:hypothetical protein
MGPMIPGILLCLSIIIRIEAKRSLNGIIKFWVISVLFRYVVVNLILPRDLFLRGEIVVFYSGFIILINSIVTVVLEIFHFNIL